MLKLKSFNVLKMFELDYQIILTYLSNWGYPIMFLLMVVEGSVTTLAGAFLASLGFFNVFIVFALSVIADLIADIFLYYLGFFSGKKTFQKINNSTAPNQNLPEIIKNNFHKNGARLIFFTKITIGLSIITFTLAGASRWSFKKFILYSFLGGIIWSGGVVILGYYFGMLAGKIETYIKFGGWFVFLIAVLIMLFFLFYQKKKFLKNKKKK